MSLLDGISAPSDRELANEYAGIERALAAPAGEPVRAAFARWDKVRRGWRSFANVTRLRFAQDTRSEAYRAAQRSLDAREPRVASLESSVKRLVLSSDIRHVLEPAAGAHAFALWSVDISTFDDAISGELVREAALKQEYTELLASATAPLEGREETLSGLAVALYDDDRSVRHAAQHARWSIFERNAQRLDELYGELVTLRDGMARTLGFRDFTELGYRRMRRTDYTPADVAAFRDEVARTIVPFAAELVRTYGERAGFDPVYFWDEAALGNHANVTPLGDARWALQTARSALRNIDPALGSFADAMLERNLFDIDYRPGKARGAFCTNFPDRSVPFVFANFNASRRDITTLMHELGHAFQGWQSRDKPVMDFVNATAESAEIHSMSLEYLSWPHMEEFFGDAAGAYRSEHLFDAMLFLPYGVAIDHFQHLVYAHPSASPRERHAMWQEVERRYLPWRDYGDLAYPSRGGLWQEKQHVYLYPFYYIDYTLALSCALQFWLRAEHDRGDALAAYVSLCGRGGEAPFRELVKSAGLRSPFEAGMLDDLVRAARSVLH